MRGVLYVARFVGAKADEMVFEGDVCVGMVGNVHLQSLNMDELNMSICVRIVSLHFALSRALYDK